MGHNEYGLYFYIKIPEENEKFQIVLLSAVGGAAIGSPSVSTIVILKNDDAIFFEGMFI